jgi:uncharacterized protein (TIGR02118 family)
VIKLSFCLKRLPHLSREEFQKYWREKHAPLVRKHAGVLRIHRYVQLHTGDSGLNAALRDGRGGPEEFDGVAELWWKSADDLAAATATPEGQRAGLELLEDERQFIDLASSPLFIGEENVVIEG